MSARPILIAIIGFGKIAHDQHVPAIRDNASFQLVATVDPGEACLPDVPHFPTIEDLLGSDCEVDAIAICTPPQIRQRIAQTAIMAGKHVLLEKPPCATLAEIAALEQSAQDHAISLFTAWHSRFAAGVAPAKAWLADKQIRSVKIDWREDVRVWHPGQTWIWDAGGFGVFDPGINALSIATEILPRPLLLRRGALQFPANCDAPVSGQIELEDSGGMPVALNLDFLQTGPQTWDIAVETDGGTLILQQGGAVMHTPEGTHHGEDCEYPAIYRHFADAIRQGRCDVDIAPLRLVADAFLRCRFERVEPFYE
ncbi:D-galactose 1-dehydrogenase [Altererythrobacter atlanticus]|uniref:Gfo/Idh/MocA family protein n=1 Tax=Croceibacterium atlanticum TaxID=1267766 RepID=UPI00062C0F1B|nr:Gfo/Idh/MocA family oxidoreductase [Croceibacterium atlanticum]MBB5732070.1 D-galactose 1-dehydrogenase [Croceibacterium atlanticum]